MYDRRFYINKISVEVREIGVLWK